MKNCIHRHAFLILGLCTLLLGASAATAAPLKIAYSVSHGEPFAFENSGSVSAGIIKDLMDALAKELSTEAEYLQLPRKRIALHLQQGRAHIKVIANPSWESEPERFYWSVPLFSDATIMVIPKRSKLPALPELEAQSGLRIGTILGYRYPPLEHAFKSGHWSRYDAKRLTQSFRMLDAGRVDALLHSEILLRYYFKNTATGEDYRLVRGLGMDDDIQLMISKSTPFAFEDINRIMQKYKRDGTIQRTLDKYLKPDAIKN
jgi:polar amino acid transport system substrate-binding protein